MKVLVTGSTGFIGQHLVRRLVHEGYNVRALVRPVTEARAFASLDLEIVRGDIRNPETIDRAIKGCSLVFHLAARTSHGNLPAKDIHSINVDGTTNVASAAARAGVARLVFASTARVYGIIKNHAVDEETPIKPDSAYPMSKARGERIVLSHHASDGLPAVVARITAVFGTGSKSWLGLFQAIVTGRFRLIGSGENYQHPGDVRDIVEGLLLCGRVKGIDGRTFIITGDESLPLRQMIRLIQEELGVTVSRKPVSAAPLLLYKRLSELLQRCGYDRLPRFDRVEFFLNDRIFDQSRALKELGYRPKESLKDAIHRTVQYYREQGCLAPLKPI